MGPGREGPSMAQRLGKPRKSGSPTPATTRKIGILLDLVRNRRISISGCEQTYGTSNRTLLRDLQELRNIGETAGFRISERENGDTIELSEFKSRPAGLVASEKRLRLLMGDLLKAFGEPLHELAGDLSDGKSAASPDESFVHFVLPQLVDGTAVATTFERLESAWQDGARVAFGYKAERRTIEPGAAVVRAGRYYLIGRDVAKGRNGWRTFSMDLIEEPIRRAGSFASKRPPVKYLSKDAVGFFKGEGEPSNVDVTFSKQLSPSAASRKWQEAQSTRQDADGAVTISFVVDDVDEVIRWALGFGGEAWVSAPPGAVARARETVDRISLRYDRS